jgi:iron(III) transport system substrate-binding protein
VVVYAAQDRVYADPVFAEFTRVSGIAVRPVHDNEATKTTGLANRLVLESARPRADVWWSNEEMRTRQLARQGIVEAGWKTMGQRQRVLVVHSNRLASVSGEPGLGWLTNTAWRGQVALAYPVFGTTAAHFLVLRQRWGEVEWQRWCQALRDNRPLVVDGNSMVVRLVAKGDAALGLTDSDDVAFARREGWPVVALPLGVRDGLLIPNTVARVARSRQPEAAQRLIDYLVGPDVRRRLAQAGALDPVTESLATPTRPSAPTDPRSPPAGEDRAEVPSPGQWERVLDELDPALRWLEQTFVR